ncbi:hypothetical protein [Salmonella enterica]|uniref:hypothetical protein n=1 Tax=Salmonella enterica TaxID=28901 RepID=UPI00398C78A1
MVTWGGMQEHERMGSQRRFYGQRSHDTWCRHSHADAAASVVKAEHDAAFTVLGHYKCGCKGQTTSNDSYGHHWL